jgi:transposase
VIRLAGWRVEVVSVARQPEVFVHELEPDQAQRLVKITRSTRDRVRLRRAGVVLASVQGRSAGEIAMMFAASENYVREVIHAFNAQGFAALDPKWSGGRPAKFGPAARQLICRIARSDPHALGQPFTTWSLPKLTTYLREHYRLVVSAETARRVLRKAGITWQRTKTWKRSRDPDFAAKMARILDLYDHPPTEGRVLCVDEFGPLNLQPRPGHGWFRRGQPARLRATYTRTHGVRQMFAALDLALRYFALDGSDYPSHAAQQAAIAGYLRWRNRHCHPKRHFAVNSKIRRPDYLPEVPPRSWRHGLWGS